MFGIAVTFTVIFRIIKKFDNSMIWFFADFSTILGVTRNIFLSKGRFLAYPIHVVSSAFLGTSLMMQGVYLSATMYFVIAIPTSCFGMYVFIRNYRASREGTTLIYAKPRIKVFSPQLWFITTTVAILSSVLLMIAGYYMGDKQYITSALTLVLTGGGFVLSMKMYIEQFYYFLVGNVINVIMFVSLLSNNINNLSSVVLFTIFTVVSSIGLYNWRLMYTKQTSTNQPKPPEESKILSQQTKSI